MDKSILDVVHESAKDLYDAGAIDKVTMHQFDGLCLPSIKKLSARQIKLLRLKNKMSQGVFASCLNASESTIRSWEQGKKHPNGPSLKLLSIINEKGIEPLL